MEFTCDCPTIVMALNLKRVKMSESFKLEVFAIIREAVNLILGTFGHFY